MLAAMIMVEACQPIDHSPERIGPIRLMASGVNHVAEISRIEDTVRRTPSWREVTPVERR